MAANWNRKVRDNCQNTMWHKLRRLQPNIKQLYKPFSGIKKQIDQARDVLEEVHKYIVNDKMNENLTRK